MIINTFVLTTIIIAVIVILYLLVAVDLKYYFKKGKTTGVTGNPQRGGAGIGRDETEEPLTDSTVQNWIISRIRVGIVVVMVVGILIALGLLVFNQNVGGMFRTATPTVTNTTTSTLTPTLTPTNTFTPTLTATFTQTVTPTFTITPTFTPKPPKKPKDDGGGGDGSGGDGSGGGGGSCVPATGENC